MVGIPADDYKKFTAEQKELANELLDVMHPMSLRQEGTVTDGLIIKNFTFADIFFVRCERCFGATSYNTASKNISVEVVFIYFFINFKIQ